MDFNMEYHVFSDIHIGAPHELNIDLNYDSNCVYLGDIFDIKNTRSKYIEQYLLLQAEHNKKCKELGIINVIGNHDLLTADEGLEYFWPHNGVLFTHFHLITWTPEMVEKWKQKDRDGCSLIKWLIVSSYSNLRFWNWKPAQYELDLLHEKAKLYNCHTVVFGHTHTKDIVTVKYSGITMINVPRGKTILLL